MNRILKLEELIKHHKVCYYQGAPEISDCKYDELEEELRLLDSKNSVLKMVGTSVKSLEKIKHNKKMLSLNKTYRLDDLKSWMGENKTISTFKIDGVSCSLIYKKNLLTLAKTRGDGVYGEDITENLRWVQNIPKKLDLDFVKIEIRGEIYCSKDSFIKIEKEMDLIGLEKPSSLRNIVAGLIGRKNNVELCRYLNFKGFDLIVSENSEIQNELKKYKILEKAGFDIPSFHLHENHDDIELRIEETKKFMKSGDFLIDGVVFTYNDINMHKKLGETAHHPRYKMAFKFQGSSKITVIKKIKWTISRNGILTPVAHVEPVELSNVVISRVTLHNFGIVEKYNLKKNDKIEIIRSGEVIPKLISVVQSSNESFSFPKKCPECKAPVKVESIRLLCENAKCPGRFKESVLYFIQKIGIDDISDMRLNDIIQAGLIQKLSDIYSITAQDLKKIDKVKDKLANKIIVSIEKSKNTDIVTFLSSLGISGGAFNKCEKIVQNGYDNISKIKKLTALELMNVDSFAEKSAKKFVGGLKARIPLIDELLKKGFILEALVVNDGHLMDKSICITGALSMKRSEMERHLQSAGAHIISSVSKKTDFLLTNEKRGTSTKFKKAMALNISIISEIEILKLLKREKLK